MSITIVYIPIKRVSGGIIGAGNYYNIINSEETGNDFIRVVWEQATVVIHNAVRAPELP